MEGTSGRSASMSDASVDGLRQMISSIGVFKILRAFWPGAAIGSIESVESEEASATFD